MELMTFCKGNEAVGRFQKVLFAKQSGSPTQHRGTDSIFCLIYIRQELFSRSIDAKKNGETLIFALHFFVMPMKLKYFLPILLLSALWFSCEDPLEYDTNEPTITLATINGSSEAVFANAGDTLKFDMAFEDDENLDKYRIQILENFIPLVGMVPYNFSEVVPLDATTSAAETNEVVIPVGTLAGYFTILVEVMDLEGNVSTAVERELTIIAPDQPIINVLSPDFTQPIGINAGDTIPITGDITDAEALDQISILIEQNESQFFSYYYTSQDTFQFWSFDTIAVDSNFVNLPTTTTAGSYDLTVFAFDTLGNLSHKRTTISVQ